MKRLSSRSSGAFTLVELLVAMSVLVLLVFLVSSIMNNASRGIMGSSSRIDADSEARSVFNRLAIDFARMLKRADLDYSAFKGPGNPQQWNDTFAFYAEMQGNVSAAAPSAVAFQQLSPFSVVGYGMGSGGNFFPGTVLNRAAVARTWDEGVGTGAIPMPDPADYRLLGSQTFRMEYTYLLKPEGANAAQLSTTPYLASHSSVDGFRDVAAIVVGIAVLDSTGRAAASGGQATWSDAAMVQKFNDVLDGAAPIDTWNSTLSGGTLPGVPDRVARTIRLYQRYFYLNQ